MQFSMQVDNALRICGTDKVFANDGKPSSVAIRRDPITSPGEKWITASGESHDDAGRKAAGAFAEDLEQRARELQSWATRIRSELNRAT